jgi:DNA-binding MarR family transcriptional regulator
MTLKPPSNIPLLLNNVLSGLNSLSAKDLALLGLTAQSARALMVLSHYAHLRCSRLSRLLGLEATALSHLLRALARKQLIIRNRVENDNRAVEVCLSDKGKRIARACRTATQAYERRLLFGLDSDELVMLQRILGKMSENVTLPRKSRSTAARSRRTGGPELPRTARARVVH